jgi:hypothetical protein
MHTYTQYIRIISNQTWIYAYIHTHIYTQAHLSRFLDPSSQANLGAGGNSDMNICIHTHTHTHASAPLTLPGSLQWGQLRCRRQLRHSIIKEALGFRRDRLVTPPGSQSSVWIWVAVCVFAGEAYSTSCVHASTRAVPETRCYRTVGLVFVAEVYLCAYVCVFFIYFLYACQYGSCMAQCSTICWDKYCIYVCVCTHPHMHTRHKRRFGHATCVCMHACMWMCVMSSSEWSEVC